MPLNRTKSVNRAFHIKRPGEFSKVRKEIEKTVGSSTAKQLRQNLIDSAYFIRDEVAKAAPKPIYSDILMGEPLEKYENYNSGFDVSLDGRAGFSFRLQLSTTRFNVGAYKGWNPIIGLLNSNYGRKGMKWTGSEKGGFPIPDKKGISSSKTPYNHPVRGSKPYMVVFAKEIPPMEGTHWIDYAVERASRRANNIIAGTTDYKTRGTTDKYFG